ncbi:MAG: selenium cofactor biosynthesis protein YqeC [Candidatus Thermoplasmatota archaeon]
MTAIGRNTQGSAMHRWAFGEHLYRGRYRIVSFVGAGGKTSLLFRFVRGLQGMGLSPIVTTTTKLSGREVPPEIVRVRWKDEDSTAMRVKDLLAEGKVPFIYSTETEDGGLRGISMEAVAHLASEGRTVLVEADGARGKPVKRLRAHEPVIPYIPTSSLVCIVVGLDALGMPISEACFNWKGAVSEGICGSDDPLTPLLMRKILYCSRGYLDVIPEGHEAVLIVNKADTEESLETGQNLVRALYHPRFRALFAASTQNDEWIEVTNLRDRIFCVILAAGRSTRFPGPKQLEPLDGTPLLGRVVSNALNCAGLERVILVLGHEHEAVRTSLGNAAANPMLDMIVNPDYLNGMSTSLRLGLAAAEREGCDAVAVLLGDMPLVDAGLLDRVIGAYRSSCCKAAFVRTKGRVGHPVIFRKDLFSELHQLRGEIGGREIIQRNMEWSKWVDLLPGEEMKQLDIDALKDIERYRAACMGDGDA